MSDTPPAPRSQLFPYYPALDGLRAYSLTAVIVHHFSGLTLVDGALLGMSGFFVLSGFLIASLLVAEHARDGRISIKRFLIRRARRLLPASMLTIAVVAVLWNVFDLRSVGDMDPGEVARHTNRDLVSALFYVLNWHTITGPDWAGSAGFAFSNPPETSPIAHFWSLAIEEQFYLVLPMIAVLSLGLGGRRAFALVLTGGLILSVATQPTLAGATGIDVLLLRGRIFLGTDVRAAEFILGALMAVAFSYPTARQWITTSRWVAVAGGLAFAVMTYGVFAVEMADSWLYRRGSFALIGAGFGVIIFALTQPQSWLTRLLSTPLMTWYGKRSYGVYVYHFTLMTLFDDDLLGWPTALRMILLVSLTFLLSGLSYTYFEQPIRKGHWPWQRKKLAADRL